MKKVVIFSIIFLLIGMTTSTGLMEQSISSSNGREILYVGGSGPGNYSTIQSAIDAADSGDSIFVYDGIYEEHIEVTESVLLEGESNIGTTVIGGFNISEDYSTIKSFNITGGYAWDSDGAGLNGTNKAGIVVSSSNNTFYMNNIMDIRAGDGAFSENSQAGHGGDGSGIYLNSSYDNIIEINTIFNITGGIGGFSTYSNPGEGGDSFGFYIYDSTIGDICKNNISNLIGGVGGEAWEDADSEKGGDCYGIYLNSSIAGNISQNEMYNFEGGKGGKGGASANGGSGGDSYGVYLYLSNSDSIISNNFSQIEGGNGNHAHSAGGSGGDSYGVFLYSSNSEDIAFNSFLDINGGIGGETAGRGGNGGDSSGIFLRSSTINFISQNIISNSTGGNGGASAGAGGPGGKSSGIFLHTSISNNISKNTISRLRGGNGGGGHFSIYGGDCSGIFIESSTSSNISSNSISHLHGGDAGPDRDGGFCSGIIIKFSNLKNVVLNLISHVAGGKGGSLTYSELYAGTGGIGCGILIESSNDTNIIKNNISDIKGNIGGNGGEYAGPGGNSSGILVHSCTSINISSNILSEIVGGNSGEGFWGGQGGNSTGIHLNISKDCHILFNNIFNITGGNGSEGDIPRAGPGGFASGLYLKSSNNNLIEVQNISNITGGNGGTGYVNNGGNGGNGSGVHMTSSSDNNIISMLCSHINGGIGGIGEPNNGTNGTAAGIQCENSSENYFSKSIIEAIDIGIEMKESSINNRIYHVNLINNNVNAVDECGNIWNDTYPSGGNFWSDYTENDLYSGPDQDIPGPDGIGDVPYEIPCEHGTDYYPLMSPFELYYILDIEAPDEVNEGEVFDVLVKSIGGTAVPIVKVRFNEEIKITDSEGRVSFAAPQVDEDTNFEIDVYKEDYTGDIETIMVKDELVRFHIAFLFGRLKNLDTTGDIVTFDAVNLGCITFFPFDYIQYTSGEQIGISKYHLGFLSARFIFAFCGVVVKSSTISMNIYSKNDARNETVWLVSGVEGGPIIAENVETILLNDAGEPQTDANITFNDVTGEGYINPGDTFKVVAPEDGDYVFILNDKLSGATLYKSSSVHY